MKLAPHLMGRIAERLEDLNTPYDDICEMRVTFMQRGRRDAVCLELLLTGTTLRVTQSGATPDAAVDAAFRVAQHKLHDIRAARRSRTSVGVVQKTWRTPEPIAAGKAAHIAPRA